MTETLDKLAKYRREGQVSAKAETPTAKPATRKKPYEAYSLSKEAKRHLEIRAKFPEPAESPLNTMITNVRGEWRMGLAVTIIYGNTMVVDIKGERLQELFQAVKDWKIEWLAEFDPQEHEPPTDPKSPFIKSIEIITHRPEAPPPLSQRH